MMTFLVNENKVNETSNLMDSIKRINRWNRKGKAIPKPRSFVKERKDKNERALIYTSKT
jgi:hypothetical protein